MRIEYGWYPEHNIWAVFAVDNGITKEFEYAGNQGTVIMLIRDYCRKYKTHSVLNITRRIGEQHDQENNKGR